MSSTLHSYTEALDNLSFSDNEKKRLVESLKAKTGARTTKASAERPATPAETAQVLRMPRHHRHHGWARIAAVAAALAIAVGGGTVAVAAGVLPAPSQVFADVFGTAPAQTEIIDKIGRPIGASATSNGVTITAQAVIGDANGCTVVFDITRDDGQPFDVTGLMMGRASENTDDKILALMFSSDDVTIDGATSIAGSSFIYNPDVSSNTTLRYVRQFDHVDFGSASSLNGQTCHVHLSDIESFAPEEYRAHVKSGENLASGTWDLTFELNYEDATVNLAAGQTTTFAGNDATIDKVQVSPIGVTVDYTVAYQANLQGWEGGEESPQVSAEFEKIFGLPITVTFADGTTEDATRGGATSSENANGTTSVSSSYTFTQLREPSDIVSVTVGDVTIPVK